jgi:hypothetical protein
MEKQLKINKNDSFYEDRIAMEEKIKERRYRVN